MQLHVARLCLDCNEVHDSQRCPRCGSEAFGYLSRWVPAPERRVGIKTATSPEAETYRELIEHGSSKSRSARMLTRGAVGLGAAVALAGWLWRRNNGGKAPMTRASDREESKPPTREGRPSHVSTFETDKARSGR